MALGLTKKSVSFAATLALVYGAFGLAWIAASDSLVAALAPDPATLTALQTAKGWVFVLASAGLIFAVGIRLLRAMESSEERYRLLFADSPEALALYDPSDLRIVEFNEAAGVLFGYQPAEIRGMTLSDLMPRDGRIAFERDLPRLMEGRRTVGVWRTRCKDGRMLDLSTCGQNVTIDGRRLRLVQMVDVTARLRAEHELLRTMDGLAAANKRMRELGHALSHDVQEPLRQVTSFVQLLAKRYDGHLDDEAHQFIAYAVEGTHRLKTLIADVERFALTSAFVPAPVRVRHVVEGVLEGLHGAVEAAGAQITVGALPLVQADPGKLAVVFHALIDNALKFRHPDRPPEIAVDGVEEEGRWLFRVRDNGIGIGAEFHEAVFSLFSRLHTRERIPGNGTGLALARKLVEAHGGRIWVDGGQEVGVTLCFALPKVPPGGPARAGGRVETATQH